MQSFIFGGSGNADTPTYEALKRKREIADLLAQQALQTPDNLGEGIASIGRALMARMMDSKLTEQEEAERSRADQSLQSIMSALSGGGAMTPELMQQAGELRDNPYLGTGNDAIVRGLMRRTVQLPEGGTPFVPLSFSGPVTVSAQNMPTMGADGGAFGWTDPGEVPPDDPYARAEAAKRQFDAQPTDMNAELLDRAVTDLIDSGANDERAREAIGWVDGMLGPQSGGGGPVQRGSTAGTQVAQADTGTMTDASVRGDVKLTEQQSKDLGYWNRMDAVTADIDKHTSDLTAFGEKMKDGVPLVGNMMVSEGYQVGRRAANEWITALLRKDTGAQVTREEWALYGPIYIPQPGDGKPVLKAKAEARKRAAEGMKAGLGIAEVLANELQLARQQAAPPPDDADADLFKKYGLEP